MAVLLIWPHFHQNRTILKIWPMYKRSMTFSYFVLYLDNATSYGYHVIDFTPYNKRNDMTCITTKLKHFEFSSAWGGSHRGTIWHALLLNWSILNFPVHEGGLSAPRVVCVYFSYGIPETVGWVHYGESFYIGEIKITGGAMPCPARSWVIIPSWI